VLLAKFGLPPDFDPTGAQHPILEQEDQAAIAKGKRYRLLGRIGIALIAVGSICQWDLVAVELSPRSRCGDENIRTEFEAGTEFAYLCKGKVPLPAEEH